MRNDIRKKVIIIIILLFATINILWASIVNIKYNKYVKAIPKNSFGTYSMVDDDGYNFNVKKPDYLSFIGNLGIANYTTGEALIIWPKITGEYEFGLRLQNEEMVLDAYIDKDLKSLHKNSKHAEYVNKQIEEHRGEIEKLFKLADELWDLNIYE